MPIYEYLCSQCGARFEKLVGREASAQCENCGSAKVSKQISSFATNTVSAAAPRCAETCGGYAPKAVGGCGGHCPGH